MVFQCHPNIDNFASIWSKLEPIGFNILDTLAKLVTITSPSTGATYQACFAELNKSVILLSKKNPCEINTYGL